MCYKAESVDGKEIKGNVFEIERYALHDGPGIRTVIFLKGCPLRCLWCANPESQDAVSELWYWQERCVGCGDCLKSCPCHALELGKTGIVIDRDKCKSCGACTLACPTEALAMAGKWMSISEVVGEVMKDFSYYEASGGGVTFSGGEALTQAEFVARAAKQCKEKGISTCLETSGCAPWAKVERAARDIDLVLYDLKQMDPQIHSKQMGADNRTILENLKRLAAEGQEIVVRIPVVPGYNDSMDNFHMTRDFLEKQAPSVRRIDLLPYHRLGMGKYKRLNRRYPPGDILPPEPGRMEYIRRFFEDKGFEVTIGG